MLIKGRTDKYSGLPWIKKGDSCPLYLIRRYFLFLARANNAMAKRATDAGLGIWESGV